MPVVLHEICSFQLNCIILHQQKQTFSTFIYEKKKKKIASTLQLK